MQFKTTIATLKDIPALTALSIRTFEDTFGKDNTPENMQDYIDKAFNEKVQAQEVQDFKRLVFLVHSDQSDLPVAYAHMRLGSTEICVADKNPIEILRLYVDKNYHGKGVAHDLMQTCITAAQERGFKTMWLGVWEHNLRAQKFYKKWDFKKVGDHIFQLGDDPQIDIILVKSI